MKRFAVLTVAVLALTGCATQEAVPVSPSVQKYYDENVANKKASLPTKAPAPTAVFIGDSYTVGAGATHTELGWARVASRILSWSPVVAADSGSGFITKGQRGMLTADLIKAAKPESTPSYVVIASGYNDSASNPAPLESAVHEALDAAKAKWHKAKFVVLGPWAPNGTVNSNQATTGAILKSAAHERGMVFVDPISQEWFKAPGMIGPDKLHPNDAGHRAIGQDAAEAITAALKL